MFLLASRSPAEIMAEKIGPRDAPQMYLRPYRKQDFEAVFQLDVTCFAPEFQFSRAAMQRFLSSRHARSMVAESGGRLVGVCLVHLERNSTSMAGYVVTLDVDPAFRRMGLARAMLLRSEADAQAEGCSAMLLHVFVGNAGAIAFYEGLGYRPAHTVVDFYGSGLDAVVYRKPLGVPTDETV